MRRILLKLVLLFPCVAFAQSNVGIGTFIDASQPGPGTCQAAVSDGVTDNSAALQCKLNTLSDGGVLFIPAGTYNVGATVIVPQFITLRGAGYGTILAQKHSFKGVVLKMMKGARLTDLQLTQEQPSPGSGWSPYLDYDFQVWVADSGVDIEDILLLDPVNGILVRNSNFPNGSVGEIYLRNIRGQPLYQGIYVDGDADISRFNDIHFWPFWSTDSSVQSWTRSNGFGIRSFRNDNPFFSEIFLFSYSVGVEFGSSPVSTSTSATGVTSRARISGLDCDFDETCIHVDGDGVNGLEVDGLRQVGSGSWAGPAIYISSNNVSATLSKMDVANIWGNVVRATGVDDSILVSDSLVRSWNISAQGFPAFESTSGQGTSILISNSFYNNGNSAPVAGGDGVSMNNVLHAPL